MTVGSDGRAYTLRSHWIMEGDCSMSSTYTLDAWYDVVVVQPTGSLAVVESLYEDHYTAEGYGALVESLQQVKIFPGAAGGLMVSWMTARNDGANPHFYVTTLNGGRSDVEVPVWVEAVGSDGSGYNALGAVDTVAGTTKWVSTEPGTVSAVLSDESVVVMTYAGRFLRIDSTGQSTPFENVSSASDVLIEPDQRLVAVGGTIVAVPGDGVELDGLFPLQDGNTRTRTMTAPRAYVCSVGLRTIRPISSASRWLSD
jgi:hypothetical protein